LAEISEKILIEQKFMVMFFGRSIKTSYDMYPLKSEVINSSDCMSKLMSFTHIHHRMTKWTLNFIAI